MVAMPDAQSILSISPQKIDRIEAIKTPYIIGDNIYGGIVHFISKNNDLAGVDLPQSGKFFSLSHYSISALSTFPDEILPIEPDFRNTIYWNADVSILQTKEFKFEFDKGGAIKDYEIVIQAVNKEGTLLKQVFPLN